MSPAQLFQICREFRDWLEQESGSVHLEGGFDCCKKVRKLPKMEQFLNLGFIQHTVIWTSLRNLRETYDGIVRANDDNWEGKAAFRLRHMAVQQGILILEYAFLPREVMEAKMEKIETDYIKSQQGRFQDMFDVLMGTKKKEAQREPPQEEGGFEPDNDYGPSADEEEA